MTELEKAIAIISAASGAETSVVAEQLTSDEAPTAAATKLFEGKFTEQRDQGDQRATKKTRTEVEKALKDAGVTDAKFSDLPAAIQALKASAAADASKGITPEQALDHQAVKAKINELTASIDAKVAAAKVEERTAFEKERATFEAGKLASRKAILADEQLTVLNPLLGDATKAVGRRAELIERLSKLPTVEVDGQFFEAENGEIKRDALGNPVKYADMMRRETERLYDLPVSTPKDSPSVTDKDVAAGDAKAPVFTHFKGEAPKTEDAKLAICNDQSIPIAARKEVADYWEKQKGQ